jgi:hypothetical protein
LTRKSLSPDSPVEADRALKHGKRGTGGAISNASLQFGIELLEIPRRQTCGALRLDLAIAGIGHEQLGRSGCGRDSPTA